MERLRRLKSNCNWIGIGLGLDFGFGHFINELLQVFFGILKILWDFLWLFFFFEGGGGSEGLVWVGFEVGG